MKEASWQECIRSYASLKVTPDKEKARSLRETAEGRLSVLSKEVNEKNINYIFEDYYSSILEMIHAIVLLEGYKVENHICLGYYIRDILKREDLFRFFDDCRYKRNSLIYYGKRMDFDTAKEAIENIKKLWKEFDKLLSVRLK